MKDKKLKVFQMNDYDWWADYSKEEARKNYIDSIDDSEKVDYENHEYIEDDNFYEVDEESLNRLFFYQDVDFPRVTFKERLAQLDKPQFFASTEC